MARADEQPSTAAARLESAAMTASAARRLALLAIVFVGIAWVSLIQTPGANQNAHLALVTAFAHGTPRIDPYRNWSGDVSYLDGHYYTAKAPGLALATLPWYLGLEAAGLRIKGPPPSVAWPTAQFDMPTTAVWEVGVFGATLPAFILLLLVLFVAGRLIPGYGMAAVLTVGTASLFAILATMFFAHALSACIGFAVFAVLFHERRGPPRLALVAAAGVLAGLGAVVEFPLAIVALVCGIYGILRTDRVRRATAYAGGFVIGILPLLAFNAWAVGSPTELAYTNVIIQRGASGHAVLGKNASGFFGVGVPSLRAAAELLFAGHGLLVLSPVLALAAVGLVALWRSGSRAEALAAGSIAVLFLIYDASYYLPYGGFPAGPRFLVPSIPFLAIGVAAAWRAFPGLTVTLFLASLIVTTAALIGKPLGSSESAAAWFHRVEHGDVTRTVLHWLSVSHPVVEMIPIVLLLAAAVAIGFVLTPRFRIDARVAGVAIAALAAWRLVYVGAPTMLIVDTQTGGWAGLAGVVGLAIAVPFAFVVARRRPLAVLPALLLLPFAWPPFAAHTGLAFATTMVAIAGIALVTQLPSGYPPRWRTIG
jgi:hypothetical protein